MEIARRERIHALPPAPAEMAAHFTGSCGIGNLHRTDGGHPVSVALVGFPAGVRNHWHRHAGGQVLHVVDGAGYVQTRGAAPVRIGTGDSITTPPGEEHWHGASGASSMTHLAVSIGETTWLEPVEGEFPG